MKQASRLGNISLRDFIGLSLIISFVGAIIVLFWKGIPQTNEQLITYMLGQLSGFVAAIVAFHYSAKSTERGSSNERRDDASG